MQEVSVRDLKQEDQAIGQSGTGRVVMRITQMKWTGSELCRVLEDLELDEMLRKREDSEPILKV